MKLFSLSSLVVSGGVALAACCCSGPNSNTSVAFAADSKQQTVDTVERDYLVKGMTCGGCVFGVKKALDRAGVEKSQILEVDYAKPDPKNKIGHAKVLFKKSQYQGSDTDCKIIKEIHESPGYIAYLDPKNTDPCNIGNK